MSSTDPMEIEDELTLAMPLQSAPPSSAKSTQALSYVEWTPSLPSLSSSPLSLIAPGRPLRSEVDPTSSAIKEEFIILENTVQRDYSTL